MQKTSWELVGLTFSPKTLLSVQYALVRVLDLTDPDVQTALATDRAELTAPWLLAQASPGGRADAAPRPRRLHERPRSAPHAVGEGPGRG